MSKIMRNNIEYAGVDSWEGTQAQYDALPIKYPNITYYITDTNGNEDQFQPIILSYDEREIGVWVNGKPLYQKTFTGTIPGAAVEIDISALNVDTVMYVPEASFKVATTNSNVTFLGFYASNEDKFQSFFRNSNQAIVISQINSLYGGTYYITIRYTKTTDTAGSGTWTPQGVPAVHYSTDEQVVGTWIDGKTIYEKVVSGITGTTITTLITGVDKVISVCGYADRYPIPMLQLDDNRKFISVVESSGNAILSVSGSQYVGLNYDIAIRYTKSSS